MVVPLRKGFPCPAKAGGTAMPDGTGNLVRSRTSLRSVHTSVRIRSLIQVGPIRSGPVLDRFTPLLTSSYITGQTISANGGIRVNGFMPL